MNHVKHRNTNVYIGWFSGLPKREQGVEFFHRIAKTVVLKMKQDNRLILKTFERYLKLQGYAKGTISKSISNTRDFLKWSETQNVELHKIQVNKYLQYLRTRRNKLKPGALSQNTINGNISCIKRFSTYLQRTGKPSFDVNVKLEKAIPNEREILTKEEVLQLYNTCDTDVYGIRDKAILSIFYGCGLRRTEGVNLNIKNILLSDNMIFVEKAKGHKQRYIPMNKQVKEDIRDYILNARDYFLKAPEPALFIGRTGKRLTGSAIYESFKKLKNNTLINKQIGLHSLRHSIATHLLQQGMKLENVSKFLGHSSLETTQIYTKVKNEK